MNIEKRLRGKEPCWCEVRVLSYESALPCLSTADRAVGCEFWMRDASSRMPALRSP